MYSLQIAKLTAYFAQSFNCNMQPLLTRALITQIVKYKLI